MDRRNFLFSSLLTLAGVGTLRPRLWADDLVPSPGPSGDEQIRDYLSRMHNFDQHFPTDVLVVEAEAPLLSSCVAKLRQVEQIVGHCNFSVINFSRALAIARNYSRLEAFSAPEIAFLESVFHADASRYGFLGRKAIENLDHEIDMTQVQKIPGTGNYLYRGQAVETYRKAKSELGEDMILTSGVRGVVKQMLLFLAKAADNQGNLSLASRQLAPPGFSFHGVGDLDVGKAGFGSENFTERFMLTDVFRKLSDLGYLSLRYPQDNLLGVRYEPWHIKIVDWG